MDEKYLPRDAVRAEIETTIIQDVKFVTENIEFKRQKYFSNSRDIHLHTMSSAGTKTKDTLATIISTAIKLSAYENVITFPDQKAD